ncbi:MAG: PHP domain-containing protein, partial [Clostridia bacterium]
MQEKTITGDYHTHTRASDGHNLIEDNVAYAKERKLNTLAITDHSFSNIIFHMTESKYEKQSREIEKINAEGKIKVLHGIEANILKDGKIDVPENIICRLDVLNLGYHRLLQPHNWVGAFLFIFGNGAFPKFLRKKLASRNTAAYIKAIETYPIDTICHLNHRAL